MTHQFTLNFTWRDWAAGTQGCETFEIAAQHPRGVFYGETALTISRQSQSDEAPTRERPQQARWCGYGSSGSPRAPRDLPRRERQAGRQWAWSVPCLSG